MIKSVFATSKYKMEPPAVEEDIENPKTIDESLQEVMNNLNYRLRAEDVVNFSL